MKYCLSVGLHNLFFDLAIVSNKHQIIEKHKCNYDRNKDIASNIYLAYKNLFAKYQITGVGVGISNNIEFKDNLLYKVKAFDFNRYDLKQSLYKLFKLDIYLMEETYLASLAFSYDCHSSSLLYLVVDNKISNSFVIDHELIDLDDDIDFRNNEELNRKCSKDALKSKFLKSNLDDDYIGGYFLSNDELPKQIVKEWANALNNYILKIIKELPIKEIAFAGYLGEYFDYFKQYMTVTNKVNCIVNDNYRLEILVGTSHLIFKDN